MSNVISYEDFKRRRVEKFIRQWEENFRLVSEAEKDSWANWTRMQNDLCRASLPPDPESA